LLQSGRISANNGWLQARRDGLSRGLEHRLRFLNAVQQSCGMGADVAVLDRNPEALRRVDAVLGNRVRTLFSTRDVVELLCPRADLVIATVLVPGSTTPKLITAQTVKAVKT